MELEERHEVIIGSEDVKTFTAEILKRKKIIKDSNEILYIHLDGQNEHIRVVLK